MKIDQSRYWNTPCIRSKCSFQVKPTQQERWQ